MAFSENSIAAATVTQAPTPLASMAEAAKRTLVTHFCQATLEAGMATTVQTGLYPPVAQDNHYKIWKDWAGDGTFQVEASTGG